MGKQEIAKALKNARLKANMTCKQVAELTGRSEKTISAWEHCNGQPDADMLFQLCEIYGYSSVDKMLDREIQQKKPADSSVGYTRIIKLLNEKGIDEDKLTDEDIQFLIEHFDNFVKKRGK